MKNKIVLIKDAEWICESSVLIFANERDIKQYFNDNKCTVEIYDNYIISKDEYGNKTQYDLKWGKEVS